METLWAVLESTIMGTIPEHIKHCLTTNGFTSISVIGQINDTDIDKLDENLSREPYNGFSSLRLGDRKLLSCLPQLIETNQDQIYGQWHGRIGIPIHPDQDNARCNISPVSQIHEVQEEIQEVQEIDEPDMDVKVVKFVRKLENISREDIPEEIIDPDLPLASEDEKEYEKQLLRQVNTFLKINTMDSRLRINHVAVRINENHITAYCVCPRCHRKISITATHKKKNGNLSFKFGNLNRHIQKSCKSLARTRNKIDDYWVKHDPLTGE